MKLKLPSFIITFLGFFVFVILHNAVDAIFGVEEAIFFTLAFASLGLTPILFTRWIITKLKTRPKNNETH